MSAEQKVTRKLRAILSADVKGYGLLMSDDEIHTIQTLKAYRQIMSDLIKQHNGRVVDTPGDNLLAEFGSAVDAVQCAVEIQTRLKKDNEPIAENKRIQFRIGVNIGDVVQDGERIYGSGVNVAARIEGLADPGGVCISRNAYDHIRDKLNFGYKYLGDHRVKNIQHPIRVYKVLMDPADARKLIGEKPKNASFKWIWVAVVAVVIVLAMVGYQVYQILVAPAFEPASVERMAHPLPDKPSIAVLPFTNMSDEPELDYIGDGLSENIITALSASSEIFVVARNSTFTYKGKPVKVKQVAEDLGVQYVLEGSIQKSGGQLRVTAQLIDALSGNHIWSEKYDRNMKDSFDLQDEITEKVTVSLHAELRSAGKDDFRLHHGSTDNLEAFIQLAKANELFLKMNPVDMAMARKHAEAALKLDPEYVGALQQIGFTHFCDVVSGWSDSPPNSMKRAFEAVQEALKIDEQYAPAYTLLGQLYLVQRKYDKAITAGKRAISLSPNYAVGYGLLASSMFRCGQFDESISLMEEALRLNPDHSKNLPIHLRWLAGSYIYLKHYDKALEVIKQMDELAQKGDRLPRWIPLTLYSHVYQELRRENEARECMAEALKINPNLSLDFFKATHAFKNPAHLQRMLDAFRKSGMPEKAPKGAAP